MNHDNKPTQPLTGPGTGQDGVDKAPGEETSASTENFAQETQKGKQQVDADLDNPNDRAIQQS